MPTRLCKQLGMSRPIFQAAIGGIACPALVAAVSNCGGCGTITLTGWGAEGARRRLSETFERTKNVFVANLLLNYDITAEFKAVLDNPPKIVSLFWGDAKPYVRQIHEAGSLVMVTVGSVDEAKRAADVGADMIVAQGWEAGGHVRGTVSTMALVPAVVDAVAPLPVIAAGGISDGRALAAALCLGASAAWIGTRFLAAKEADIHPDYQNAVLRAKADETFLSALFDSGSKDVPGRVIENETTRMWVSAGRPAPGKRPREGEVIIIDKTNTQIKRYQAYAMRSEMRGKITAAPLWAGQGVGSVNQIQTAEEIMKAISSEAMLRLAKLGSSYRIEKQ